MWQSVCRMVNSTAKEALLSSVKSHYPLAMFQARAVRLDSYADQVDLMFDAALKSTFSIWDEDRLADLARRQAIQVSDLNKRQLTQALVRVMGVGSVLWDDRWLKEAVEGFVSENVALISSIPEQAYTRSRSMVMRALERGTRVEDLSSELEDTFDVSRSRANLIGRDQTCKFYGQVNALRQKEAGVQRYVWRTVGDERVRSSHAELEGTEQRWDDPPVTNDDGDHNNPGEDFQCFTGDSKIDSFTRTKQFFSRRYDGELTTLVTDSGKTLKVTPNHPVLTPRGWVPAKAVKKGDYLFGASLKHVTGPRFDVDDSIPSFEKVFQLAKLLWVTMREDGLASQFHGDGCASQDVYVIPLKWGLERCGDSGFLQLVGDEFFGRPYMPGGWTLKTCLRNPSEMLRRIARSLDSLVRGRSQSQALLRSGVLHAIKHCFRPGAVLDATGLEQAVNSRAHQIKFSGECFDTGTLVVSAEKVLQATRAKFNGHVYNLETRGGWYLSNGIIARNCRCTAEPIFEEEELNEF